MADYDKYYQTPDLFGSPFTPLLDFFQKQKPKGKVLDLGCGQGRNAIAISRLGFDVTGIDISQVGINQMLDIAKKEQLNIKGVSQDIFSLKIIDQFDYILLDSMFHFNKKDKPKETAFIRKIVQDLNPRAILCICIQDTGHKVSILKKTIQGKLVSLLQEVDFTYTYEDPDSNHHSITPYKFFAWVKI